jgi:4'-phosphopantetheinyl transferase
LDFGFPISDDNPELKSKIQNLKLSISHCNGHAFCALSDTCGIELGVDIERIEPRAATFAEDYFTAHELGQLRAAPPERRDMLVTLIWSAKEAALKALRLGLTVDTRSISCTIGASKMEYGWAHMDIACDQQRIGLSAAPMLRGFWHMMNDYVLTVAATSAGRHRIAISESTKRAVMLNEVKHLAVYQ